MPSARPLFRGLSPRQWLNLLWTAFFAFYLVFGLWYVAQGNLCDYLGADYRAFYASAQIARERGFAQVYDLRTQDAYQRPLYAQCPSRMPYDPVPMPYLPAFALLFLPMTLLPYLPSYGLWSALNLALIVLYMFRFKRALGTENGADLLAQLLICLPVFSNLFLGQVNGWLLIGLSEFLLALIRGKDLRAGLWLGLLLVKPQTLVLLLPGLLFGRRWLSLAGFALAGAAVAGISLLLAGGYALGDLALLILRYVHGLPTNAPEIMMNWRALAFTLHNVLPHNLAWAVSMGGLIFTAGLALTLWSRPSFLRRHAAIVVLGTYAATCAVTWHAHVHMALPLIPLLLYLYARQELSWKLAYIWLLGPYVLFPLLMAIQPKMAYPIFGQGMLAMNLILVTWTTWRMWQQPAAAGENGGERTGSVEQEVTPGAS